VIYSFIADNSAAAVRKSGRLVVVWCLALRAANGAGNFSKGEGWRDSIP